MYEFKILVDADACPVNEIIAKVSNELKIDVLFFCDLNHILEVSYGEVKYITPGKDAVDFAIMKDVEPGDLVITQDYGLAAMVLGKKGYALHYNGKVYTHENIDQMLFERHLHQKARRNGKHIKGKHTAKRKPEMDLQFEHKLRQFIKEMH